MSTPAARERLAERAAEAAEASSPRAALFALRALRRELDTFARDDAAARAPASGTVAPEVAAA